MNCINCGGDFFEVTGDIELQDNSIGSYIVKGIGYLSCPSCGKILLPLDSCKVAELTRKQELEDRINKLPVGNFIGATRAAEMIGISRQALHQNKKIQKGFVYSKKIDNITLYDKKSVSEYINSGDGRYPLKGAVKDNKYFVMVAASPGHESEWNVMAHQVANGETYNNSIETRGIHG